MDRREPTPRIAAVAHVVAIAITFAAIAWVGARPLWHDDLFVHMRTGEMVAQTRVVPTVDPFTFTVAGTPWTSHEWGFGLVLYGLYRLGGLPALLWLMPILLVGTFAAIYLEMRRALQPERLWLAAPLLALGLGAAEYTCLVLRAALLTTLGLALVAHLLRRLRERASWLRIAALGFVLLAWANMHAGVVFGLWLVGLHWLQAALDAWRTAPAPRWRSLLRGTSRDRALLVVGCAALTLLNPSGFDLWTFSFRVNELFYRSGIPWILGQYRAPVPALYPLFFTLIALCMLACLPLRRFAGVLRDPGWPALANAFAAATFFVLAVRSNRFIFDFVVFALPFCAVAWGGAFGGTPPSVAPPHGAARRVWLEAAGLALALAIVATLHPGLPRRVLAEGIPVHLADFMEREHIEGRMFNPEPFGGYLGWRLRRPVFWDGRNDIYGPLAKEYAFASDEAFVKHHALDVLVMNARYHRLFAEYLQAHRGEWALIYWDEVSAIYLKRTPGFQRLIERWEYTVLQPFGLPTAGEIRRLVADPTLVRHAALELDRALSQSDENFAAWYLRGRIAQERGDLDGAYRALSRAVGLAERGDALFHLARAARDLGRDDEARALLDRLPDPRAR